MVSRDDNKYVLWPRYFDKSLSRLDGRRVPKKFATENPSIEDIIKAAKSLGLNPVLEKESIHPSHTWKKEGRVLIDKKEAKSKLIAQISKRL